MPKFFANVGFDDPRTDYFVWLRGAEGEGRNLNASADALNRLLLETFTAAQGVSDGKRNSSQGTPSSGKLKEA